MDCKSLGNTIASLRHRNNITQAALAERLGVSNKAVSKWESGQGYPDISLLPTIAEFFGVSIDYLLLGEKKGITRAGNRIMDVVKNIEQYPTIGMLVTTDGSITDIPRESYVEAEQRVADELKKLGKPFAIVLNSARPGSDEAKALALELEEKYGVPVALVSCPDLNADDIREILALVLGEFPIKELKFKLPEWTLILPNDHPIRGGMIEKIGAFTDSTYKIGDIAHSLKKHGGIKVEKIDAGDGTGELSLPLSDEVYYDTLAEMTGLEVGDKKSLFATVTSLADVKKKYEKVEEALNDVESKGYGIVMPTTDEMRLDEPRLVKQSGGYGLKVSARAESIHMIKTGIRADLCPVVGTAEQSEEVVKQLIAEYEDAPEKIWGYNMFGKSLYDLVSEGMRAKLEHMPDDSREKLGETLERIINEGAGGLLCILL